jgi:hypothetical protein
MCSEQHLFRRTIESRGAMLRRSPLLVLRESHFCVVTSGLGLFPRKLTVHNILLCGSLRRSLLTL